MEFTKKNIVITGAMSGIGKELAKRFIEQENTLLLIDINPKNDFAGMKNVIYKTIDVTDKEAMQNAIGEFDKKFPVDAVFASAGISYGSKNGMEDIRQIEKIFAINLNGTLNAVLPIAPLMQQRRNGTIVLFSSMAGFIGWGSCPSYSATKGALRLFGEGLSVSMKPFNVDVHVVCPGFIKTAMTEKHTFKMRGLMTVEEAVQKMLAGIKRGRAVIVFPKGTLFKIKLFQSIPFLYRMALSKMPKKEPMTF